MIAAISFTSSTNLLRKLLRSSLVIALLGTTGLAHGQQDEARWYQIELLVFATDSVAGRNSETWRAPNQLNLNYPPQTLSISEEGIFAPSPVQDDVIERPSPYQEIPANEWSFKRYLRSMDRNGGYRTLFHSAWRQPLEEKPQAIPILVQGGREYSGYYELEGYVTLSVSRYLHIDTNLWLVDYAESIDTNQLPWNNSQQLFNELMADDAYSRAIPISSEDGLNNAQAAPTPTDHNLLLDTAPAKYEPIHLVEFKQSRRMRSGELHYLDHPMMGILIRLTPFEVEKDNSDLAAAR